MARYSVPPSSQNEVDTTSSSSQGAIEGSIAVPKHDKPLKPPASAANFMLTGSNANVTINMAPNTTATEGQNKVTITSSPTLIPAMNGELQQCEDPACPLVGHPHRAGYYNSTSPDLPKILQEDVNILLDGGVVSGSVDSMIKAFGAVHSTDELHRSRFQDPTAPLSWGRWPKARF